MTLKILIASNDQSKLYEIEKLLDDCAGDKLECERLVGLEEALKTIERNRPEVLWVDLAKTPIRALSVIGSCRERFPSISIVASGGDHELELTRMAYRLGALNFMEPATWRNDFAENLRLIDADRIKKKKQLERQNALSKPGASGSSVVASESLHASPATATVASVALSILIVCDDKTKAAEITNLVQTQSRLKSSGVVDCRKALDRMRLLKPKIVWIDISSDPKLESSDSKLEKSDSKLELVREIRQSYPDCKLIASSENPDLAMLNQCFRAGVSDYLTPPRWKTDLPAALQAMYPRAKSKLSYLPWLLLAIVLILIPVFIKLFIPFH